MGLDTIHHVHADDLGQLFEATLTHRHASLGESFNGVSARALSLLGCCEFVAHLFGREPNLAFADDAGMTQAMGAEAWGITREHITHSPCCSIEQGQRLLGYAPRFTTEEIYVESIEYLLESGQLVV